MKTPTHIIPIALSSVPSLLRSHARAFLLAAVAILSLLVAAPQSMFADNATWKATPGSSDWEIASNWSPATVPNANDDGIDATATFATSSITGVSTSNSNYTTVNGIVFNSGASAYTLTASPPYYLYFDGVGITNNSGITQKFVAAVDVFGSGGSIYFVNGATAGNNTTFTLKGGSAYTYLYFNNYATAGSGSFILNGASPSTGAGYGSITFDNVATAENGTFTIEGSAASGYSGSYIYFNGDSTAASGTFTIGGGTVSGASGGYLQFNTYSAAGNSTLIANGGLSGGSGGVIYFNYYADGETARVEVFGNGTGDTTNGLLDISGLYGPGTSIGSLEGSGVVQLGINTLVVGSNNRSTTFSGVIQDYGYNSDGGDSLTKVGTGKLSLTKASTYFADTTVKAGSLFVLNKTGSATGTGNVRVNAGTLGGTGKITGTLTLGTGSGIGAFVSPGTSATKPGTLTVTNNTVTFNSDSTYKCALNRATPKATQVAAKGVSINSGAQFVFADAGAGTLTAGTVFTVINNTTASSPITGTFGNLANGATFTSNGTTFKAAYAGGTGNDLTLTVQ